MYMIWRYPIVSICNMQKQMSLLAMWSFSFFHQVWSVNRAKRCLAGVAKLWDHFQSFWQSYHTFLHAEAGVISCWLCCGVLHGGGQLGRSRILSGKVQSPKLSKDFPSNALRLHHDNSPAKSDWDSQLYFCIIVNPTTVDSWSFTFRSNEPPPTNQASSSCPVSIGLLMLPILRRWRGLKSTLGWNVFGLSHIACDELFWLVATGWVLDSGHLESILWSYGKQRNFSASVLLGEGFGRLWAEATRYDRSRDRFLRFGWQRYRKSQKSAFLLKVRDPNGGKKIPGLFFDDDSKRMIWICRNPSRFS